MKFFYYLQTFKNKKTKIKRYLASVVLFGSCLGTAYYLNVGTYSKNGKVVVNYPELNFKHNEILGVHDYKSVRRGFQIFREVCSACHNCNALSFRNLVGASHTQHEAEEIAKQVNNLSLFKCVITEGPDVMGKMSNRPGRLTDYWPPAYQSKEEATVSNNGAVPPDLCLLSKTKGSENYVFNILCGYQDEPPPGIAVSENSYYNPYTPSGFTSMPPPLYNGKVKYDDGTPATVSQMAKDVSTFMKWVAETDIPDRKKHSLKIITCLVLMVPGVYLALRLNYNLLRHRKFSFQKINWK